MTEKKKLVFAVVVAAVALVAATAPLTAKPKVTWQPDHLALEPVLGEAMEVEITFTADANLGEVEIWLTPSLEPYITIISPTEVFNVKKGDSLTVVLEVFVPLDEIHASLGGTVHVRQATRARKTISKPLPVEMNLIGSWSVLETDNFELKYPPLLIKTTASSTHELFIEGHGLRYPSGGFVLVLFEYNNPDWLTSDMFYELQLQDREFTTPEEANRTAGLHTIRAGLEAHRVVSDVIGVRMERYYLAAEAEAIRLLVSYKPHHGVPEVFEQMLSTVQSK